MYSMDPSLDLGQRHQLSFAQRFAGRVFHTSTLHANVLREPAVCRDLVI